MRSLEDLIRDTEPFPDKIIQKLPPRGDDYVPWYQYAQRLLLHHGDYSWTVASVTTTHQTNIDKEGKPVDRGTIWAVVGTLHLDSETYGAVGEASTPTSAESNAFKRACAHAGIGLHLYGDYWLHERLKKEDAKLLTNDEGEPVGVSPEAWESGPEEKLYDEDDPERPF